MLEQYKYLLVTYSIALKQKGKNDPDVKDMWTRLKNMELLLNAETIINCTREAFDPLSQKPHTPTSQPSHI